MKRDIDWELVCIHSFFVGSALAVGLLVAAVVVAISEML